MRNVFNNKVPCLVTLVVLFFIYIFTSVLSGPYAIKDKGCPITLCDISFRYLLNALVSILLLKDSLT